MASKDKLVRIMEILRQTDADHPITAQEIRSALRLYGIEAERKGICRDINVLKDCGWDILACEDNRKGWYLASREFEDWELKLLMDAVSQITVLPQREAEALVKKLCGLSSAAGCISLRAMTPLYSGSRTGTPAVKRNLDTAIGAIQHGHQLGFQYAERLPDMSVQPKRDGRLYLVNPYALLCQGGRYFLVCNTVPHENLSFYRLDRMLHAEERATALTPAEQFLGPNADLAINQYVQHSLFRYGGDKIHLVLQTHDYMADELADNFGTAAKLHPQKDGTYRYEVDVNDSNGLVYWLLQHADYVKVLEPESVRERLVRKREDLLTRYKAQRIKKEIRNDEGNVPA